jgi:hypothetical protein
MVLDFEIGFSDFRCFFLKGREIELLPGPEYLVFHPSKNSLTWATFIS